MILSSQVGKPGFVRIIAFFGFAFFTSAAFGQQPSCTVASTLPTVHAEGLAEQIGDLTVSCSGGAGTVTTLLIVTLNANITNRVDADGNLSNITIAGAATSLTPPVLNSARTVLFNSVQLPGAAAAFTISGVRVAVPTVTGGTATTLLAASVSATLLKFPAQATSVATIATGLLSSVLNFGVPCLGSPAPASVDFPGLLAAGTVSSTLRITEGSSSAFAAKSPTADFGVRVLAMISGYGSNATVYVPDVIVGNRGTGPTSAGTFGAVQNSGVYTPGLGQLLLARVIGADANGAGGTLATAIPAVSTTFSSVTQLSLVNGAASVTYEVLDANAGVIDSAQVPVFVVVPASSCSTSIQNTLVARLAPVSTASQPTQADPIPRFIATTPASDCTFLGDCSASYFPTLQVTPASIVLNSSLFGQPQTSFIAAGNAGSGQLTFNVSTTYQTAANLTVANWLTVTPTSGTVGATAGINSAAIKLTADPSVLLVAGTYQATVTITAGSAGTTAVVVTFNVGGAGVVIQSIVNAANSLPGPVTAGSFAAMYGVNLVAKNTVAVTFNGFPAIVSFDGQPTATSPSQINVLVPAALGSAAVAGVVATIDGVVSNTFAVKLVPNAPGVFNPGILNQDNSVNLAASPASRGDVVQVFLTGLATPVTLPLTVNIGTTPITGPQISYAGVVASIPGLEQINVQVPPLLSFSGNSAPLSVCVPDASGPVCSAPVNLYLH
jgi:uncharacterized protein (TIGR03437 family)